jgi:DNA-binding NarL/FixJ family response regulator
MEGETASPPPPVRLLIADDHPMVRKGMLAILGSSPGLEVVGEAQNGREAVDLCRRLSPRLVLMDVLMPEMDGLEATRAIKRELPHIVVLIVTAYADLDCLLEALKAGAAGYVLKDATPQQFIDAIGEALSDELPLDSRLAGRLLTRLAEEKEREERSAEEGLAAASGRPLKGRPEPLPALEGLSPREVEVLRLLAQGQTNQEIAKNLFVSTSTVKKHIHRTISKLGVSDRVQAAVRAVELGLLSEERERK